MTLFLKNRLVSTLFISTALIFTGAVVQAKEAAIEQSTHVIVSRDQQTLKVYRGGEVIAEANVSTGRKGYTTPTGIFSILQKRRRHFSNLYNNAPMPHMQRLTWSGIALHGSGHVPRYPASHGCIRLPRGFAKKLFGLTQFGAHVIVSGSEVAPREITHDLLASLAPKGNQQIASLDTGSITDASPANTLERQSESPLRVLITRNVPQNTTLEVQKILNELGWNAGDEDGYYGQNTRAAIERFQTMAGLDVTGQVSKDLLNLLYKATNRDDRMAGRIYIRQNFKTIYEAPIDIENPERPLGAHLLNVAKWSANGSDVTWNAVSLSDKVSKRQAEKLGITELSDLSERQAIEDVLGRIVLPEDVQTTLKTLLTARSSISISDKGLSRETAREKGTDFIVLTNPKR